MAKIVDYKKDLPILNRQLDQLDLLQRRVTEMEGTIRRMEERLKKLEHA